MPVLARPDRDLHHFDEILVVRSNLRLIDQMKKIAPRPGSSSLPKPGPGLDLYNAGADYVYLPNRLAAQHLLKVVEHLLRGEQVIVRKRKWSGSSSGMK